jgi:diguanylate cyclase (GGDEF)-like protein/PAS domain S-box-containing protein
VDIHWAFISGILFLNSFISLYLSWRGWSKHWQAGQDFFAMFMLAAGYYALTYGFELLALSLPIKIFWLKMESLGIVTIPIFWFLFAFRYTQNARWFSMKNISLFFIVPLISLIFIFSPLDKFYYVSLQPFSNTGGPLLITSGVWYWIQIAQNYILLLLGALVILRTAFHYPGVYRSQSLVLLIGILIPWAANGYYLFGGFIFPKYYLPLDITALAFIATGAIYSFGVFRLNFLDIAPIAREIVFENIPEMVLVLDESNRVVDVNKVGQQWLGMKYEKITGHHIRVLFKGLPDLLEKYGDARQVNEEVRINSASPRDLELMITPLTDSQGQLVGRVVVAHNITSRNQAATLINQHNELIHLQSSALNVAVNAVVITDLNGRCIWTNRAFSEMTGYASEEALGKNLSFLKSGVQSDNYYKNLWETITSGNTWQGEIVNRHKFGHLYMEEMTIAPVYNDKGFLTNYIAVKQDITARKRMELDLQEANQRMKLQMEEIISLQDKLREQAIRDPLTELYNRRILEETLEREVSHARRDEKGFCVAMIDIDNFKGLNDRYGHIAGDMILKSLGKILENNTRRGDIACRYGGEEFAVLMPNATPEGARKRAHQWCRAFQMLHQSFNGQEVQVTLSVGIAHYPEHGPDGMMVLESADKALYKSKKSGKNQVTIFVED